jgi:ferric-dicitrate binding protein FerR (iron transport regulator)
MPTTVPPRDDGAAMPGSAGSVLPDEDALRRAFFGRHAVLAGEARAALGDEAAGLTTKVVEGAFVRAWDARARLTTPQQLDAFLTEDVHHAAVRALSRRAGAHRLAEHESHGVMAAHDTSPVHRPADVELDPEESWPHILHAVRGDGHSQHALDETAAIARHGAAGHIVGATREGPAWKAIGFGAAALIAVLAFGYWVEKASADVSATSAVNASDARVVNAPPGQIGIVTLDDGSKVRLAPESKLSIPTEFGPSLRAVKLDGAAGFDVAKGGEGEFRVYAGDAVVIARGTSFSVRSYAEDSATTVVVTEGNVEVREGKSTHPLPAGSALFVMRGQSPRPASADEREEADGWRSGTLTLANRPLRDVLPQLRRWYDLDVKVPDSALLDRRVTLRASLDSTRQAIRGIEQSAGVTFGYQGQTMVFEDSKAKPSTQKQKD